MEVREEEGDRTWSLRREGAEFVIESDGGALGPVSGRDAARVILEPLLGPIEFGDELFDTFAGEILTPIAVSAELHERDVWRWLDAA